MDLIESLKAAEAIRGGLQETSKQADKCAAVLCRRGSSWCQILTAVVFKVP
jgi:hypothetical protein